MVKPKAFLKIGDLVEVVDYGKFSGMIGKIIKIRGKDRSGLTFIVRFKFSSYPIRDKYLIKYNNN